MSLEKSTLGKSTSPQRGSLAAITHNFVLLKPEAMAHEEEVLNDLLKYTGLAFKRYSVSGWRELSREIYGPQMSQDPVQKMQFECYANLTTSLFGDKTSMYELLPSQEDSNTGKDALLHFGKIIFDWKKQVRVTLAKQIAHFDMSIREGDFVRAHRGKMDLPDYVLNSPQVQRILLANAPEEYVFKHVHTSDPDLPSIESDLLALNKKLPLIR